MKKKIIIFIGVILLIGVLSIVFLFKDSHEKIEFISNESVEKVDNILENNAELTEIMKEESATEKIEDEESTTLPSTEITTKTTATNNISEKKTTSNITDTTKNNIKKSEQPKQEQPVQNEVKPIEQPTITETKKDNIWDKLGMTEYQYYNEPMYKWQKVDFSVDKYGSEDAAREACAQYGDKYEPYLKGEVLYNCSTVNTASGKYLGEWFHTEELIR